MVSVRRLKWLTSVYAALLVAIIAAANNGSLPVRFIIERLPGGDKWGHFLLMGLLSLLVNLSLSTFGWRWFTVLRGCVGLSLLVGLEELSQIWLHYRAFELMDLAADVAGIFVFGGLAGLYLTLRGSPRSDEAPSARGRRP